MAAVPVQALSTALPRRWLAAILIAAALSFAGKLAIASRSFGSTDALLWEANLRQLREAGPAALYRNRTILRSNGVPYHSEVFNHPPFMLRVLSVGGWLADHTRMPWHFWLRAACATADLASTLLLLGIIRGSPLPVSPLAVFLVAASPVSLLISGFHGNTDPVMMAFLLLTVFLVQRGLAWQGGAALGLAAGIKIVPFLFLPVLMLSLCGRKRAVFLASVTAVFIAGSLPFAFDHPALLWSRVFAYSPQSGIWGISRLVAAFGSGPLTRAYDYLGKDAVLLVLGALSVWLNLRRPSPPLVLQCALVAFALLSLTPGFGVQYLAWLVPWACLLSARQATAFHAVGGVFLSWYYTRSAHGFPWQLADSAATQVWYGTLIFAGLICWMTILWMTYSLLGRMRRRLPRRAPPGVQLLPDVHRRKPTV